MLLCWIAVAASFASQLKAVTLRVLTSCNVPIKVYLVLLVLHDVHSADTSAALRSRINITGLFHNTSRMLLSIDNF